MDLIAAYMSYATSALRQNISMSVADMAMTDNAEQMTNLAEQIKAINPGRQIAPIPTGGIGHNIDTRA